MSSNLKNTATKEDGQPALAPKLRFPEFLDAEGWKERLLKVIADPVSERAIQGQEDKILSLSAEHGIVLQSEFFGKKVAGDNSERYLKIARNDFVYNDRTTKASTYGTIKRLSKHSGGIVSPIYKCFRFHADENPVFWEWYFQSGAHDSQLGSLVNEGARAGRFNISISQFLSTTAWRPDHPEQQKIADCLSSVDELIVAQVRKLDALKTHKKGLMQQLFPREGETQPRLRFPEFRGAGEWEEEKLGNIVEIWSGNSPSKYTLSTLGKYAFVKVEDLNNCTKYQTDSREYCDDSDDAVPRCAILFPKRGASIELNKIRITASEMLIDTNLMALSPDGTVTVEFLYYFLVNVGLAQIADMSTIPQINNKHIIPFKILLPSKLEQESIADGLTTVDDLVAAQSQKLEALKTHKKGLMQQLFPSTGSHL